ncbi:D-alanyl-D-alanine carboxypeptidase [uncultured Caudovirales phage]|uniref:D-alanyl-D-alanine carboxypeptidase n=1 Tax=uncultured Caudovirales phage TaxID=2100421 RepID=A0A6J7X4D4_9CAUD|nr:D-alanyl-D-alanine carboxypeptidase [uncultured Caudovirales phage]
MITTAQATNKYGIPSKNPSYLTTLILPYPMRLAWDKSIKVNKIQCHKLIHDNLQNVFKDILAHYSYDKIVELGIDLFGGCFNFRTMRGGTEVSRHSWGIAIDLDPERNQLKETSKTARFARIEYKPMIDIFYKYGFVSLGREKNYDFMHFEIKN